MNANLLIGKIIENGYTIHDISVLLDVSKQMLIEKFNNINRLTIGEARILKCALDLSDSEAISIFLGE